MKGIYFYALKLVHVLLWQKSISKTYSISLKPRAKTQIPFLAQLVLNKQAFVKWLQAS